jgi:hypothetical protein
MIYPLVGWKRIHMFFFFVLDIEEKYLQLKIVSTTPEIQWDFLHNLLYPV